VELSDELESTPSVRWRIQSEPLLQNPLPGAPAGDAAGGAMSVWDLLVGRYEALCARGEEMIVRLITAEVEADLKKHLQRYVPVPLGFFLSSQKTSRRCKR
jgi:hypothetical protein